jgi:hypothetical protein
VNLHVRCHMPDTRYQTPLADTRYQIPNTRYYWQTPDTRFQIPDTSLSYYVPQTKYQVPDIRYQILDTRYYIADNDTLHSTVQLLAANPAYAYMHTKHLNLNANYQIPDYTYLIITKYFLQTYPGNLVHIQ